MAAIYLGERGVDEGKRLLCYKYYLHQLDGLSSQPGLQV